ncbi:MAG: hypothetical protein KA201_23495 [Kofleriaceae bacterium]|nr:hypothetical protein [Kofleriaceae bacterium]
MKPPATPAAKPPGTPASPTPALGLSRRRLLGGALTAALTAALVPRDVAPRPAKTRWRETTRWIGHA